MREQTELQRLIEEQKADLGRSRRAPVEEEEQEIEDEDEDPEIDEMDEVE